MVDISPTAILLLNKTCPVPSVSFWFGVFVVLLLLLLLLFDRRTSSSSLLEANLTQGEATSCPLNLSNEVSESTRDNPGDLRPSPRWKLLNPRCHPAKPRLLILSKCPPSASLHSNYLQGSPSLEVSGSFNVKTIKTCLKRGDPWLRPAQDPEGVFKKT